ncbi:MAG: sulfite exporter TauE/SafE family protein [Ktedonobacteraceae bacterium]
MVIINYLILFVAAILGGTLNSVAGGGSFIGFPALIYTNVVPKLANTTNTIALWPGSLAAAWALRKELASQNKALLLVLGITSLIGGTGGALLLLSTPEATFVHLIPYLMLAATLLFAISPLVNARLKQRATLRQKKEVALQAKEVVVARFSSTALAGIAVLQLVIAVYGGYFGGGIGILMLASLGVMGMENIHEMNAVKNMLATCINGVAVITFVILGAVVWPDALVMIGGALIGGFGGAYYARKLDPKFVRGFVIVVGCTMTVIFFFKYGFL